MQLYLHTSKSQADLLEGMAQSPDFASNTQAFFAHKYKCLHSLGEETFAR